MQSQISPMGRFAWLRILLSGLVIFVIIERVMIATGNINYFPSLLIVGSVTMPLSFCALLYSRVKIPDVPWRVIGISALWGGVIGSVVAGYLEYGAVLRSGTLSTLTIGVIEEIAKLIVPIYFLLVKPYKDELDGIIIGAAAGAGFAVLESMGYGLVALLLSQGNITDTVQVLLFRGLMSPAAHIAWTSLISYSLWCATYTSIRHRYRKLVLTFIFVVLLHALWDSVGVMYGYFILGATSLIWLFVVLHSAEKKHEESDQKLRVSNPAI
jgi:RsiW-degrading membrane proteinase PrsW (M82 family)